MDVARRKPGVKPGTKLTPERRAQMREIWGQRKQLIEIGKAAVALAMDQKKEARK